LPKGIYYNFGHLAMFKCSEKQEKIMSISFDLSKLQPMALPGSKRWIISGKGFGLSIVESEKNAKGHPAHKHPQEQTLYLIDGKIEVTIGEGEETRTTNITGGTVQYFPPNVLHGIKILENSKYIDIMCPNLSPMPPELHPLIAGE
jgi:quercetin dioxygenase-like cupin family protein